jgi:hypothetical protein
MKQLFKTTLLAATIAATCGTAVAGDVTTTKSTFSNEGLSVLAATATVSTNALTYTMNAEYIEGDKVTVDVTAGLLNSKFVWPPSVDVWDTKGVKIAVLSRTNSLADSVKYRLGAKVSGSITTGAQVNFGALTLNATALAAGNASVSFTSLEFGGSTTDIIDGGAGNSKVIADTKTQLTAIKIGTKLDGIIDVKQERKAFLGELNDSFGFTIGNDTTLAGAAAFTSSTVVMNVNSGDGLSYSSANGTTTYDKDTALLTVTYAGGVTNDTITITPPTGSKAQIITPQSFNATASYVWGAGATATSFALGNAAAGAWTLNGAMVNIPYMPYSPSASQIMYISNEGNQAGDIVVTAFDDKGNLWDLGVVGQANAKTVTKAAPLIEAKLKDEGFTGGKLSITITVNAPSEDITVYASYNNGSVRGFVNTDQYKE